MNTSQTSTHAPDSSRVIGTYSTGQPGPSVVVLGGIHGNEPSGTRAAPRVLQHLEENRLPLRGELVVLRGNLAALAAGRRYIDLDLNRLWTTERIASLRNGGPATPSSEGREQIEILEQLEAVASRNDGPLVVMDLHTTSSEGPPFIVMSDTLRNRRLALAMLGTVFLGLEESVDGTLLEFLTERGHTAVVVEGGQHEDPASERVHEAAVWMGLVASGALRAGDLPDLGDHRAVMREATRGLPRFVELRQRWDVADEDRFRMEPGYHGFQRVGRGEVVAQDRNGPIRFPESGRIVMPLYQEQGNDGFFVARDVHGNWLRLSTLVRRLGWARALPLLPGVSVHPDRPYTLVVDPRLARLYTVEIFHLFGFRKRAMENGRYVFSRRRPV